MSAEEDSKGHMEKQEEEEIQYVVSVWEEIFQLG